MGMFDTKVSNRGTPKSALGQRLMNGTSPSCVQSGCDKPTTGSGRVPACPMHKQAFGLGGRVNLLARAEKDKRDIEVKRRKLEAQARRKRLEQESK
jgi:hypothetical protein